MSYVHNVYFIWPMSVCHLQELIPYDTICNKRFFCREDENAVFYRVLVQILNTHHLCYSNIDMISQVLENIGNHYVRYISKYYNKLITIYTHTWYYSWRYMRSQTLQKCWGGWGCEVSCGGHHRLRGKTTTGSALDEAVFDIAQILAHLVHDMSRS